MKQDYVNIFAKPVNQQGLDAVLLCLRLKDDWQKGKFNLIGGRIEKGESVIDAAIRELHEESGLSPAVPGCEKIMGTITGSWGTVYCVKITVPFIDPKPNPGEEQIQHVAWANWRELVNSSLLIPNLRVIIPLMSQGVMDWEIRDEGPSWRTSTHAIEVIVKSDNKASNE